MKINDDIFYNKLLNYSLKGVSVSLNRPRGFNGSVNIPESCDFRSQFDILNIIF